MFSQIFLSAKAKPWAIITYKHGIQELPHNLPNDLRLRILGNQEISGKCLNLIDNSLVPRLPAKMKVLLKIAKKCKKKKLNFSCCVLFHMKTRVTLKYFVSYRRLSREIMRISYHYVTKTIGMTNKDFQWLDMEQIVHLNSNKISYLFFFEIKKPD